MISASSVHSSTDFFLAKARRTQSATACLRPLFATLRLCVRDPHPIMISAFSVFSSEVRAVRFERLTFARLLAEFVARFHVKIVVYQNVPPRLLSDRLFATRLEIPKNRRAWRPRGIGKRSIIVWIV